MKKIGIITLTGYNNYGNRLQNYATQEILNKKGFDTVSIRNHPFGKDSSDKISKYTDKLRILYYTYKNELFPVIRRKNFKNFNRLINESKFTCTRNNKHLNKLNDFDGFVIGSDQIWNPYFRNNFFIDFLDNVDVPGISLAASFGISRLPDEEKNIYKNKLEKIDHISVREYDGKDIVERNSNKKAHVVIDPTMMLSKEEWNNVTKPHRYKPKEKYILTYTLGKLSPEAYQLIKDINFEKEYKIVNLGDKNIKNYYEVGPAEFIDYIKDAELVVTDSFHGIVFSSIYNVPFVIFDRHNFVSEKSMYSRINTFSKHFNIEHRKLENVSVNNVFDIDFKSINSKIREKQSEFDSFLEQALKSFGD